MRDKRLCLNICRHYTQAGSTHNRWLEPGNHLDYRSPAPDQEVQSQMQTGSRERTRPSRPVFSKNAPYKNSFLLSSWVWGKAPCAALVATWEESQADIAFLIQDALELHILSGCGVDYCPFEQAICGCDAQTEFVRTGINDFIVRAPVYGIGNAPGQAAAAEYDL